MEAKFSTGDVVQLKSGGPAMTISEVQKDYGNFKGSYRCKWFKGASNETSVFEEDTLQPYVAPKKA
ncbi:hypothetical protein EN41_11270 [Agrobacterium tumefaciens]|jgi:uncharacterized protein YodC (DUF2158 family)|uniref:DUF2158 domain-containing protein n=1 Tax=Agrobacterium fabrum (strain C58 / ATCC 33970) TaxID=176299 RepID=Q8U522_AGRFC|nr:YodC family protein [Agrobacterium fabrum]KEY50019.1 hypothetical protein EN41_11270 [Agrobacterium tumefaciens]AAK88559.1 conserved hypothetical protein [Agrobacterium fabrum str. C58]MCX2878512.1 YodC family protein [Agrobacterium fabrum]NMV73032.1 YodC family protein [Agrobacterium fabrum]QQN08890.1 YodC family protein [Agrobacterium fabrum]